MFESLVWFVYLNISWKCNWNSLSWFEIFECLWRSQWLFLFVTLNKNVHVQLFFYFYFTWICLWTCELLYAMFVHLSLIHQELSNLLYNITLQYIQFTWFSRRIGFYETKNELRFRTNLELFTLKTLNFKTTFLSFYFKYYFNIYTI